MKLLFTLTLLLLAVPLRAENYGKHNAHNTGAIICHDGRIVADEKDCPVTSIEISKPPEPLKIEWVGHPMVSDNHPYTPSQGWIPSVEIGLREDGVVVWRKK